MKINSTKLGMLVAFLILTSPIFGVGANSVGVNQADEKVLVWGQNGSFGTDNVVTDTDTVYADYYFSSIYNGLVKRSLALDRGYTNDLAASMPTVSSDSLNWTFTLRPGLKFSDGTDLNASSVVFSYKVKMTAAIDGNSFSTFSTYFTNASIYEVDNLTVQFNMTTPYAFATGLFSSYIISEAHFGPLYAACELDVADCNWNTDLNGGNIVGGAAAWMTDVYNTVDGFIEMIPNPFYYNAAQIKIDRIVIRTILDSTAAKVAFAAGDINIFDSQYKAKTIDFAALKGVVEEYVGAPGVQELSINHNHPYFGVGNYTTASRNATGAPAYTQAANDTAARNIRKAMSHMIDRTFISDEITGGLAVPATSTVPNIAIGWDETLVPHAYNVTKAYEFMEAAGFDYGSFVYNATDPTTLPTPFFEITVLSPTGNADREQWAALMVTELPKIGIGVKEHTTGPFGTVSLRTWNYGSPPPTYDLGGFDIFFVGFSFGLDYDPTGLYELANFIPTGFNFYSYDNATTDAAIAAYVGELSAPARIPLLKTVQALLYDDLPVLPIVYSIDHWAWSDTITGLDGLSMSQRDFEWELVDMTLASDPVASTVTTTGAGSTGTVTETGAGSTGTVTETGAGSTETTTKTEDTPVSIAAIFFAMTFTAFIALYRRRQ